MQHPLLFGLGNRGIEMTVQHQTDPLAPIPFSPATTAKEEDPFAPTPLAPWYQHPPAPAPASTTLNTKSAPEILSVSSKEEPLTKPKRPLTAYNLYFHSERLRLIESRSTKNNKGKVVKGKVAFAEMARIISKRWNEADSSIRAPFCHKANVEKLRYLREKQEYNDKLEHRRQIEEKVKEAAAAAAAHAHSIPGEDPYIAELARKLDHETADLIVRIFG